MNVNVLDVVQLQTIASGLWILAMVLMGMASKKIIVSIEAKRD